MKKVFIILLISALFFTGCFYKPAIKPIDKENDVYIKESTSEITFFSNKEADGFDILFEYSGVLTDNDIETDDGILKILMKYEDKYRILLAKTNAKIMKNEKLFSIKKTDEKRSFNQKIKLVSAIYKEISVEPRIENNSVALKTIAFATKQCVNIPIIVNNVENVSEINFYIEYDNTYIEEAEYTTPEQLLNLSSSLNNFNFTVEKIDTKLYIKGIKNTGSITLNGEILSIKFNTTEKTGKFNITFSDETNLKDSSGNTLNTNYINGEIEIGNPQLLGDFDTSKQVDIVDFIYFAKNFITSNENSKRSYLENLDIAPAENKYSGLWEKIYDFKNPDLKVDLLDFIIFAKNYGKTKPENIINKPELQLISPADNSEIKSGEIKLEWSVKNEELENQIKYELYFGGDENPPLIKNNLSEKEFTVTNLRMKKYYWKVNAVNSRGMQTESDIYSFEVTEIPYPNNPPEKANAIAPLNNAEKEPCNLTLKWTCSDPDGDDIKYDVWFGPSSEGMIQVASNIGKRNFPVANLEYDKYYYWKIISKDSAAETQGDVFKFKTAPKIEGGYVCTAANDDGLIVFDTSNPQAPFETGKLSTGGKAQGVDVIGTYAYIANGNAGLYIADVSVPSDPSLVASIPLGDGNARKIHVVGNYAYVAVYGSGLYIVDISNPETPAISGKYTASDSKDYRDVFVSGNYAYIASEKLGLVVINVSDPLNPRHGGGITQIKGYGIFVCGKYAFLSGSNPNSPTNDSVIYDISTPEAPKFLSYYEYALQTAVYKNYMYSVSGTIKSYEISNKSAPTIGLNIDDDYFISLEIENNYIYVGEESDGLFIFDISQPDNMTKVGQSIERYRIEDISLLSFAHTGDNPPENPYENYPDNNQKDVELTPQLFWRCVDPDGDKVTFDIYFGNQSNPAKVGENLDSTTYVPPKLIPGETYYWKVVAKDKDGNESSSDVWSFSTQQNEGSEFTCAAANDDGLIVFDTSNPQAPFETGKLSTGGKAQGVDVIGTYAYIANGNAGLYIADVSVPSDPSLVASIPLGDGNARKIHVVGNYAYVAVYGSGLYIVDISNPETPAISGKYTASDSKDYRDVFVSGNYAYIASEKLGLVVINVSDPLNPRHGGGITQIKGYGIFVCGKYAFLSGSNPNSPTNDSVIYDISTPEAPKFLSYYEYALQTAVYKNYMYSVSGTIKSYEISNKSAPTIGLNIDDDYFISLEIENNYIYVGEESDGLFIFDISQPDNMTKVGQSIERYRIEDISLLSFAHTGDNPPENPYENYPDNNQKDVELTPQLFWRCVDPDGDKVTFDIYFGNQSNPAKVGENLDSTTYVPPKLIPGETYYWKVVAKDKDGNESSSDVWSFSTQQNEGSEFTCAAANDDGLIVFDTSNPQAPFETGKLSTGGKAQGVDVIGTYAYIANGNAGLYIADVSVPSDPSLVASIPLGDGNARKIHVVGNYAYVAVYGSGLYIVDISNPETPAISGKYTASDSKDYRDVFVSGNYAYIASEKLGLVVINVSDPLNPRHGGGITQIKGYGIFVCGKYAFLSGSNPNSPTNDSVIYDISTPEAPKFLSYYEYALQTAVYKNYMYSVSGTIKSYEISNKSAPTIGLNIDDDYFISLEIENNYIYVGEESDGLFIFDISQPDNMTKVGQSIERYRIEDISLLSFAHTGDNPPENPYENYPDNNQKDVELTPQLFWRCVDPDGDKVTFDIYFGNQSNPAKVGENLDSTTYVPPKLIPGETYYWKVVAKDKDGNESSSDVWSFSTQQNEGSEFTCAAANDDGLIVFDTSNPQAPFETGKLSTGGKAQGVDVIGTYAYIANGNAGLYIADVSVPSDPSLVASIPLGDGDARKIHVVGNYAYVAVYDSGLYIVDISNPNIPVLMGKYVTNNSKKYNDIYVSGKYAYIASDTNGLVVIDVSDPENPRYSGGEIDTDEYNPTKAYGVYINGKYAFLSGTTRYTAGSLIYKESRIFDISNPHGPRYVGGYDYSKRTTMYKNYIYPVSHTGVDSYDISNPAAPLQGLNIDINNTLAGKAINGYLYVGDYSEGLFIFDINRPENMTNVGHSIKKYRIEDIKSISHWQSESQKYSLKISVSNYAGAGQTDLSKIRIKLYDNDGNHIASRSSDSSGNVYFNNLPKDKYTYEVFNNANADIAEDEFWGKGSIMIFCKDEEITFTRSLPVIEEVFPTNFDELILCSKIKPWVKTKTIDGGTYQLKVNFYFNYYNSMQNRSINTFTSSPFYLSSGEAGISFCQEIINDENYSFYATLETHINGKWYTTSCSKYQKIEPIIGNKRLFIKVNNADDCSEFASKKTYIELKKDEEYWIYGVDENSTFDVWVNEGEYLYKVYKNRENSTISGEFWGEGIARVDENIEYIEFKRNMPIIKGGMYPTELSSVVLGDTLTPRATITQTGNTYECRMRFIIDKDKNKEYDYDHNSNAFQTTLAPKCVYSSNSFKFNETNYITGLLEAFYQNEWVVVDNYGWQRIGPELPNNPPIWSDIEIFDIYEGDYFQIILSDYVSDSENAPIRISILNSNVNPENELKIYEYDGIYQLYYKSNYNTTDNTKDVKITLLASDGIKSSEKEITIRVKNVSPEDLIYAVDNFDNIYLWQIWEASSVYSETKLVSLIPKSQHNIEDIKDIYISSSQKKMYVGAENPDITIIDISDLGNPVVKDNYDSQGAAYDIDGFFLYGYFIIYSANADEGLSVFDVENPDNIVHLKNYKKMLGINSAFKVHTMKNENGNYEVNNIADTILLEKDRDIFYREINLDTLAENNQKEKINFSDNDFTDWFVLSDKSYNARGILIANGLKITALDFSKNSENKFGVNRTVFSTNDERFNIGGVNITHLFSFWPTPDNVSKFNKYDSSFEYFAVLENKGLYKLNSTFNGIDKKWDTTPTQVLEGNIWNICSKKGLLYTVGLDKNGENRINIINSTGNVDKKIILTKTIKNIFSAD